MSDIEAARQEFEQGTAEPSAGSQESTAPAQTIEELEIAVGGKPFKLPVNAEIPVKHNGQILKTPLEKLLNSFRQGTHLEERVAEYKRLKEELEKQRGDLESFNAQREKYGAIQDWSEKNPQEWERLWGLFQNRDKELLQSQVGKPENGVNSELVNEIARLKSELGEFKTWKQQLDSQEEERRVKEDTQAVKAEIDSFRKEWPELDLDEKNIEGVPLSSLIIHHGIKKGIGEFKLAALDFLGSRMQDILVGRGRNEATKAVQQDKRQGVVARSSTPFGGQSSEADPSKMTASERTAAAKAEFAQLLQGQQ